MTPRLAVFVILLALLASCTTAPFPLADARFDGAQPQAAPRNDWAVPILATEGATWETTIAISPANPRHAVAAGMRSLGRGVYIVESYWTSDGGFTWQKSAPLGLQTDRNTYARHGDSVATIACDAVTGDVIVAWLDRRDDPKNTEARLYAARSTDGGATFNPPQPISSPMSIKGGFLGHYNGSAAHGGVWLSAFSDGAGYMSVGKLDQFLQTSGPRRRSVRR